MDAISSSPFEIKSRDHSLIKGRRIVVVLETLELGGAERQAVQLAEHLLHKYEGKVEVWGFADEGRAARLCESLRISWKLVRPHWGQYSFSQWMKASAAFAYLLRRARAEIFLPYCARSNVICALAWRLAGAKACIWNQRDEGIGIDRASIATQWAVRSSPAYVSNSRNTAEFLVRTFGVPLERIPIVHNGVELAPPRRNRLAWRSDLRIAESAFVACMLANIHRNKDHTTLLKAWRLVLDNTRSSQQQPVLLLAGSIHPEAEEVKILARELNLGQSVRFLGPVDDVAGLLSAADLGVFSSKSEGCPNGVLESMASGLPIVATDIPGIREAVGIAGREYLAPVDNAAAFAVKIIDLAPCPNQLEFLGKANRDWIRAEFSPHQMVNKMVTEISKILDRRNSWFKSRSNGNEGGARRLLS